MPTLANQITLLRMALVLLIVFFLIQKTFWFQAASFAVFLLATATDWIDGWLARHMKDTTSFGALADPLADKLLIAGALTGFLAIYELQIPAWCVFLILAREFIITGFRSLAALKGRTMKAERWGKGKMLVQSVCVSLIFVVLLGRGHLRAHPESVASWPAAFVFSQAPYYLSLLILVVTWASGIWYLYEYRKVLFESWGRSH
ncbi:MAG: CDP-diacylglycerol--glycerol-3-phosphate 3-phosphatidyltransferase [Elusimicrobia bacterium]|nr:CDP-diacylglycerol--glycerol-3-phosphate 3-phosphatidyltransferase [Elusimicrobiota bacterium]